MSDANREIAKELDRQSEQLNGVWKTIEEFAAKRPHTWTMLKSTEGWGKYLIAGIVTVIYLVPKPSFEGLGETSFPVASSIQAAVSFLILGTLLALAIRFCDRVEDDLDKWVTQFGLWMDRGPDAEEPWGTELKIGFGKPVFYSALTTAMLATEVNYLFNVQSFDLLYGAAFLRAILAVAVLAAWARSIEAVSSRESFSSFVRSAITDTRQSNLNGGLIEILKKQRDIEAVLVQGVDVTTKRLLQLNREREIKEPIHDQEGRLLDDG